MVEFSSLQSTQITGYVINEENDGKRKWPLICYYTKFVWLLFKFKTAKDVKKSIFIVTKQSFNLQNYKKFILRYYLINNSTDDWINKNGFRYCSYYLHNLNGWVCDIIRDDRVCRSFVEKRSKKVAISTKFQSERTHKI